MSWVSKTYKRATHSVKKAARDISHNKWARAGVSYLSGFGEYEFLSQEAGAAYAYLRGSKDAKKYYDLTTGHYARVQAREQRRLEREQQKQAKRYEQQQREYAFNQRKKQIDELRERVGAGGYRTKTQDRKMSASLFGGNSNGETLG